MQKQKNNNVTNILNLVIGSLLVIILTGAAWKPMIESKAKPNDFEIQIKMLNGKNLPEVLKGVEGSIELEKYLLITIVNNSRKMAWFHLKIYGKNPNVSAEFEIKRLPPSNKQRMPITYLIYIGAPLPPGIPDETEFTYEIKKLFFQ
jgi:hypothetical protein